MKKICRPSLPRLSGGNRVFPSFLWFSLDFWVATIPGEESTKFLTRLLNWIETNIASRYKLTSFVWNDVWHKELLFIIVTSFTTLHNINGIGTLRSIECLHHYLFISHTLCLQAGRLVLMYDTEWWLPPTHGRSRWTTDP